MKKKINEILFGFHGNEALDGIGNLGVVCHIYWMSLSMELDVMACDCGGG